MRFGKTAKTNGMLSYQHAYHAGNLADVHKHMMLASALDYLKRKEKPLTYIETHAGRGLYDLSSAPALKTGEAGFGVERVSRSINPQHPFMRVLEIVRTQNGARSYPGSPLLAASLLRPMDHLQLAELHPQEFEALSKVMRPYPAKCHHRDGFELAHALTPPTPRRGLMLIDPSWEVKSDYDTIPRHIAKLSKAWNVGIICLWYPILTSTPHAAMMKTLQKDHPHALRHEVRFPPAREGHGMIGSGFFCLNPPYGLVENARETSRLFAHWFSGDQKSLT